MTDIPALADKIIALINSKPASPRRDEIVAILNAGIHKPQFPSEIFKVTGLCGGGGGIALSTKVD